MRNIALIIFLFIFTLGFSQEETPNPLLTEDIEAQRKWVDSIYNAMSPKERVGQLFMVQAFSNKGFKHENQISAMIQNHHIGGVIYSKGGPTRQIKLDNNLQSLSNVPLMIGVGAEWGLSMRFDCSYACPWNMTLGAVTNNNLIEQAGNQIF